MSENIEERVVTEEGLEQLTERLNYLKTVKRYEIADRIKVARGYGDLSENAEYDEAKQEQGFVEGEINNLENILKNIKVVKDDEISTDVVSIGNIVKVNNSLSGDDLEYRIVGSTEANIREGKLSNESPVGKALVGHRVGDQVSVEVPAGKVVYKILDIRR